MYKAIWSSGGVKSCASVSVRNTSICYCMLRCCHYYINQIQGLTAFTTNQAQHTICTRVAWPRHAAISPEDTKSSPMRWVGAGPIRKLALPALAAKALCHCCCAQETCSTYIGSNIFGHGCLLQEAEASIPASGCVIHQQPGCSQVGMHMRHLMLHGLKQAARI